MKCIYCEKDKQASFFAKREHVIPQAFGKFVPDNLVLRECVCDECNQFFGDKIELFLGRDTFESIERLRHGMKPKEPLRRRRRVKSKINSGQWKGALVKDMYLSETGNIAIQKVAQAGFYHKERDEYDFYEPNDIPTGKELAKSGYEIKHAQIWLIAEEGEELDKLIARLIGQGITIKSRGNMVKGDPPAKIVPVETEITIDRTIMRGFCKIAFNYLAFIAGHGLVLSEDFNDIRQFVRNDKGDSELFFAVNQPYILYDDQRLDHIGVKVTEGHLIIVGWRGMQLVSKISLFNTLTFGINLCKDFKGIWRPIKSGHHFDVESKQVSKLVSMPRSLIP